MNLGLELNQKYIDGGSVLVLGPVFDCSISEKVTLGVGLGFGVVDDIPYDDLDTVVGFKFGYQF